MKSRFLLTLSASLFFAGSAFAAPEKPALADKLDKLLRFPGDYSQVCDAMESSFPAPIPAFELDAVRRLIESELAHDPCPLIHEGAMVEVTHGPLKGVIGRLVRKRDRARLVLAVDLIGQAVSVEVDAGDVRPY